MNYKLKSDGAKKLYRYNIFNGNQQIGWIYTAKDYIPIVFIHEERHKLDKKALAEVIKGKWKDSEGIYFLVAKLVKFDYLLDS